MARKIVSVAALLAGVFGWSAAQAWHVTGVVACDQNGNGVLDEQDIIISGVVVKVVSTTSAFMGTSPNPYFISLPDVPETYTISIVSGLPPGATFVSPPSGEYTFTTSDAEMFFRLQFLLTSATCTPPESPCWMTGGGVKFETVTRTWNAQMGPRDTVGGNVYPSCSQFPGNGGNWNHVAHSLKLHLHGTDIEVLRCGNVEGIDPGTESPVCGVNFIEFEGTGTVAAVGNSKAPTVAASFFGRVEDRNEPGNENANDPDAGEDIDRYFLRVVDGDGNLLILVDADGVDDGAVDPLTITGGNFQIHCTSCEDGGGASAGPSPRRSAYFLRGDSNMDGVMDIADPIYSLGVLFLGEKEPRCSMAADANDDGGFDMSDPVMSLSALFLGSPTVPQPFPRAGADPTDDFLDCLPFSVVE